MKTNDLELEDIFPNNKEYLLGECYLKWDRSNRVVGNFIVDCNRIDDLLITEANPSLNSLTLIDGTIIDNLNFIVRPTYSNCELKAYGIGSSTIDGKPTISIINYDDGDSDRKNDE